MISIPIWCFVLLCIGAGIFALGLLMVIICVIATLFVPSDKYEATYEESNCPYEIDHDDPDYNPEYIPPVEREHTDD